MPGCCVIGCSNRSEKGYRLFRVPSNKDRRKIWLHLINRGDLPLRATICDAHFDEDQFENNRADQRRLLKHNAVPSLLIKTEDEQHESYNFQTVVKEENEINDKEVVAKLERCLRIERQRNRCMRNRLAAVLMNYSKIFDQDQLEFIQNGTDRGVSWSSNTLRKALKLYMACGSDGYKEILKQNLPYPNIIGVRKKAENKSIKDREKLSQDDASKEEIFSEEYILGDVEENIVNKENFIKQEIPQTTRENNEDFEVNIRKKYTCLECGKIYRHRSALYTHKKNHHTITQQKKITEQKCPYCDFIAESRQLLGTHMSAVHDDEKKIKCDYCDKKFFKKQNLKIHVTTHTGNRNYVCEFCGKSFTSQLNFEVHKSTHEGVTKFECSYCGKGFVHSRPYTQHLLVHTAQSFACDECGVSYRQASGLRWHKVKVHSGEPKFECTACDERFFSKRRLAIHKRAHTGTEPYKCGVCSKRFNWLKVLKVHMRIHTGEKPFVCEECGAAFTQKGSLNAHLKRHKT